MAWRSYIDPSTGGWWTTDDAGQFIPGNYADQLNRGSAPPPAPSPYPQPGYPGGNPYGWNMAGGQGQLPAYNDALNQEYLRQRLLQLDIPGLDLQRLMGMLGVTGYYTMGASGGGAPSDLTPDSALDYIWNTRSDLANFYTSNGWDISSPEKQRAAVQNWLSISPEGKAAGGDPVRAAQALGAGGGGGNGAQAAAAGTEGAIPTFAREQWNQGNKQFWNQFLNSMSGARNWERYSKMLPQVFGAVTGQPSWEQAATNFARSGQSTPTSQQLANWWNPGPNAKNNAAFTQPTAMNWADTQNMTPSQRAKEGGRWSYAGLNPDDMWQIVQRARPTGQANPYTTWGG